MSVAIYIKSRVFSYISVAMYIKSRVFDYISVAMYIKSCVFDYISVAMYIKSRVFDYIFVAMYIKSCVFGYIFVAIYIKTRILMLFIFISLSSTSKRERMKKMYHFFINPFISTVQPNYKKMYSLAYDHFIALESSSEDAVIMNQYLRTKPVFEDFKKKYEASICSQGTSIAGVEAFKQIFDVIPKKIRQWEVKILNIIDEDSATYVTLLPSGKRHLYRGSQEQIRSKLKAFEIQLGKYPEMQAIYEEVKAFNIEFHKIFSEKGLKTSDTNKTSDELRLSHDEMGLMLYRNLLGLCEHYAPDTHKVEVFFKMQLLRKHKKKMVED